MYVFCIYYYFNFFLLYYSSGRREFADQVVHNKFQASKVLAKNEIINNNTSNTDTLFTSSDLATTVEPSELDEGTAILDSSEDNFDISLNENDATEDEISLNKPVGDNNKNTFLSKFSKLFVI